MRTVIVLFVIVACVIGLDVHALSLMEQTTQQLTVWLDEFRTAILVRDVEQATFLYAKMSALWQQQHGNWAMVLDFDELESLDMLLVEMEQLIVADEEQEELLRCCVQFEHGLEHILSLYRLSWASVF